MAGIIRYLKNEILNLMPNTFVDKTLRKTNFLGFASISFSQEGEDLILSKLFEEIEKAINEGEMYIYWSADLTQLQKNYLQNIGYYIANKTGEYDSAKISWEYVVGEE